MGAIMKKIILKIFFKKYANLLYDIYDDLESFQKIRNKTSKDIQTKPTHLLMLVSSTNNINVLETNNRLYIDKKPFLRKKGRYAEDQSITTQWQAIK